MTREVEHGRMTPELFLSLVPRGRSFTIDALLPYLDTGDYWDNRSRTDEQKRAHVARRLKAARDEAGFPLFVQWSKSGQPSVYDWAAQADASADSRDDDEWPEYVGS